MKRLKYQVKTILYLSVLVCFFANSKLALAQLAEEDTVLAYLIEMYRKTGKDCEGTAYKNVSTLVVSPLLTQALQDNQSNGKELKSAITEQGLTSSATLLFSVPKLPARQAFSAIRDQDCKGLMGDFNQIATLSTGDKWIVLLAKVQTQAEADALAIARQEEAERLVLSGESSALPSKNTPPTPPAEAAPAKANIVVPTPITPSPITPSPITPTPINPKATAPTTPSAGAAKSNAAPATVIFETPEGKKLLVSNTNPAAGADQSAKVQGSASGTSISSSVQSKSANQRANFRGEALVAFDLINITRSKARQCGNKQMQKAATLAPNQALADSASKHLTDMIQKAYFAQQSPDGKGVDSRASAEGFAWTRIAENLAKGQPNAHAVLNAWLQNPQNCENLMSSEFDQAGIAFDPRHKIWVLDLGKKI